MPGAFEDRRLGTLTSVAIKAPCKAVTTTAITLNGEQTVGGVACVTGDRVLVAISGGSVNNGIWSVDTGDWSRARDFDGSRDVVNGTFVLVAPGTSNAQLWAVYGPADPIVIGSSAIDIRAAGGDAATILLDLANTSNATKGAGMVGFVSSLVYGANTVGAFLRNLTTTAGAAVVGFTNTATGLVSTTVQAAIAELAGRRRVAQNILPNTRWQIITGHVSSAKYDASGTALVAASVSSYTTGANTITCNCADTSALAVGRLVAFSAAAHANLKITAARVLSIVANTSFTVRLPNGLTAPSSAACTAQPVDAGGSSSAGSGNAFDGWSKTTTLQCWRDDWSANTRGGSKYAAGLKKGAATAEIVYAQIDARDLPSLLGKTCSIGGWVKAPTGGSWRVFCSDSVSGVRYGSTVTTTGYTWAEASFDIPSGATSLAFGFELIGASGLLFYLTDPVAGVGSVIGQAPVSLGREWFVPIVKYSPQSFFNANITFPASADAAGYYSFVFDAYAETGGAITPDVRGLDVILEGFNASAVITGTGGRNFATRDQLDVPHKYGPIMFQQVASVKTACSGFLPLGPDGTAYVYGLASDNWANVSMDINAILL